MRSRAALRRQRGGHHPAGRRTLTARAGCRVDPPRLRGRPPLPAGLFALPALLLAAASLNDVPRAQPGPPPAFEHEVKASFVYTVAKFVDWPERSFERPGSPLVFEVLGEDPLEEALERAGRGKTVNGHPVEVIKAGGARDLPPCHVLYVGRSEAGRLREVLDHVRGGSVLTVGEMEHFAESGGVMGLRLEQNMIRFEVNVDAAARAHLSISSKILKLGKVIRERKHAAGAP